MLSNLLIDLNLRASLCRLCAIPVMAKSVADDEVGELALAGAELVTIGGARFG